jgi:hypothetical protein
VRLSPGKTHADGAVVRHRVKTIPGISWRSTYPDSAWCRRSSRGFERPVMVKLTLARYVQW